MKKSITVFYQLLKGLVFFALMVNSVVYAGSYAIGPVRSTLSLEKKIDSLTVTNQGKEPAVIQMEVMQWEQDDLGNDVFAPTKDILATPPVFTVPVNSKQIIRLGLRRPPSGDKETAYRLFLKELPPAPKDGFVGLVMALNMSIPIFVLPKHKVAPQLTWQIKVNAAKQLVVIAQNLGAAHVQVANFTLQPKDAAPFALQQVANYMLPNQRREWIVKEHILDVGQVVQLQAQTDAGEVSVNVVVE